MEANYTIQDLLGILRVLPFFAIILLTPGYLAGWATNVLAFRSRGAAERLVLSVALSCAVSPFIVNFLCRFLSVGTVSFFFLFLAVTCLVVVLAEWRRAAFKLGAVHWTTKVAVGTVGLWGVVCLLSLPDLQLGQRIYSTAATWDFAVRSGFIASALRNGAPPANPFFYPGSLIHARYYYYWNVLCAVPEFLSGASPRIVLYASCLWSGLCLASIIPVYLKHFLERQSGLRLATIFGFGLLAVTGLDLVPTYVISLFHTTPPYADMEWWDPTQSASWMDSLLWVPHHVASLVACLAGFLFSWKAAAANKTRSRIWLVVLSAAGYSSAAGLSVYVTFAFVLFVAAWVAYLAVRGKFVSALPHCGAGALAVLMSVAYLGDLLGHGSSPAGGGSASFVAMTLRELPNLFSPFISALGKDNKPVAVVLYVLFLMLTLFLELGVYFAVGVFQLKHDWKQRHQLSEAQKCLWFMVCATLVVVTFCRSTVIGANDLAWRSSLILQFVLLLWTSAYLADRVTPREQRVPHRWKGRIALSTSMMILILIGGASSLYQLFMLRTFAYFSEKDNWKMTVMLAKGHEAFLTRSAFAELDRTTPTSAIVQYSSETKLSNQFAIYSQYQAADVFGPGCPTPFGGSPAQCPPLQTQLHRVFNPDAGDNPTKADVARICNSLGINVLMVNAQDPIWNLPNSWIWQTNPSIHNDFVRVYRCNADL